MVVIRQAAVADAPILQQMMRAAFREYDAGGTPSSAMNETVASIQRALKSGERAKILYLNNQPVAMVRYEIQQQGLYFYRLAVHPLYRGRGFAKQLLEALENDARREGKQLMICRVRQLVSKNIQLYQSRGYHIDQETTVQLKNHKVIPVAVMHKTLTDGVV
ncbi:MAG: GNAT family N-acetyltransferase [Sporolactobacillus sp.]